MQADPGLQIGLMLTAIGFGFRHGIDWDHIAALTDITGSQVSRRRSIGFASLYAAGHALVVFVLGFATIVFAAQLPSSIDSAMEKFVGATLVALGIYVVVSLARDGREFRMRSRWMLVITWFRRSIDRLAARRAQRLVAIDHDHVHDHANRSGHAHSHGDVPPGLLPVSGAVATEVRHRHAHGHVAAMPADPFAEYAGGTAFGVGMLHGVGAETPTQVLIFVTAAGASGKLAGVVLLLCFLSGLLVANSAVAVASTFGFIGAKHNFGVYATISAISAFFSLIVGALFLIGQGGALPSLFAG